ncbi:hypothetical protein L0F63_002422, partial [Massospora cicadina]
DMAKMFKQPHYAPAIEMTPKEYQEVYKLLLQAIDGKHDATNQVDPPDELAITLLPHQRLGFNWMVTMENSPLKGGLLSDDMGLGKTIQTITTIVKQKKHRNDRAMTLLVAPLALLYQWKAEIESKVKGAYLRVCIHHATSKVTTIQKIEAHDVVLTTYSTLACEYKELIRAKEKKKKYRGIIYAVTWNRVVLDEAHTIKNRKTKASLACRELKANFRWCLTGTPIQNSVDDLFSIVSFLRVEPYCNWSAFKFGISFDKHSDLNESFRKVRKLLEAISLRRCKNTTIDGQPILKLPPRKVVEVRLNFSPEEQFFYASLEGDAQRKVQELQDKGELRSKYMHVLVLLLRLRQACIHPRLTFSKLEFLDEEKALAHSVRAAPPEVETFNINLPAFKRLVESDPANDECPVCFEKSEALLALSPCGHLICSSCVEKIHTSANAYLCPSCRGRLQNKLLVPLADIRASHPKVEITVPDEVQEEPGLTEEQQSNRLIIAPSSSKLDKLIELLRRFREKAPGDKVIVYTQFTSLFKILGPLLIDNGFRPLIYDGTLSIGERADTLTKFSQNPKANILLLSLHCGSVGLNLTSANRVIFLDLWWNPAIQNQAIDRVHRIGQSKAVKVYKLLIPSTVEDRILELQSKKQKIFDDAFSTDGGVSENSRLSVGELIALFHG